MARVAASKGSVAAAVLGLALAATLGMEVLLGDDDGAVATADLVAGWALLVGGAVAWRRQPRNRNGLLLAATGVAWFVGTAFPPAVYLHRALLAQTILSYPTGRLTSRRAQVVVAAAYAAALEPVGSNDAVTLALAGALVAAAALELRRVTGPLEQARRVALASAIAVGSVLVLGVLGRANGWDDRLLLLGYDAVVALVGVVLATELARGRWADSVVSGLIVDLGRLEETGTLRGRLASALGDPSLALGYPLDDGSLVDDAGRLLLLPRAGSNRRVTPIDDGGERIAVLIHDDAVVTDALLVESVAAAARLTIANARLQAESRARTAALVASRLRIAIAVDEQRRRIERELRLGAAARLDTVAALLADARHRGFEEGIAAFERELAVARADLDALGRGLYPAVLAERGLAAALDDLAQHAPIPVALSSEVGALEPEIEAAVYFTCAESLANVVKHASASRVTIAVREMGADLVVTIVDDGVGGARFGAGSGLQGLADRVDAISPGAGTRLTAIVPDTFSARVATA
jgi:signal transduction histidine kinase